MGRYVARRLTFALLLVFIVSSAALLLTRLAPGDFITESTALVRDDVSRDRLRSELGLDRPLAAQYLAWLGGVAQLDFGRSLLYSRPVLTIVGERTLNTAILASVALTLATVVGIPLGIYSGTMGGVGSLIVRGVSTLGLSLPPLVGSLVLVFLAARTGWLPVGGMTSSADLAVTFWPWLIDLARHVPVPALALAIPMAATLERMQSEAIAAAVREPFVTASRARGADRRRSTLRHAWPVSLRPVLGFYGVMIGSLFSGSFIVEVVTAWPGLGRLMYEALRARDLYLVAGCAAMGAVALAVGTVCADLLLAYADPRVRSGERA